MRAIRALLTVGHCHAPSSAILARNAAHLSTVAAAATGGGEKFRRGAQSAMRPDAAQFSLLFTTLLDRITRGLAPMAAVNEGFALAPALTTHADELSLTVAGEVRFILRADRGAARVVLAMPATSFSGGGDMRYRYDERKQEWIDENDGHLLIEKLSRDLVAALKGYPDF